ncbi:uncharacterized protein LOC142167056 [Nicotiana tabacum]|uniref:Uncharacterized protein LOC142167056 n=1 Tax=Nicotiana tabacum TaxID=4097 RepID=A0AC58SEA8_TOBAC
MWLQQEGFIDMVKEWWQSYFISGSPDFILVQKLMNLKKDISNRNRDVYGKVEAKRTKALEELSVLDQTVENRALTQVEKQMVVNLKVELTKLAKAEDISWRQKSRCLWLKEGDMNTRYFQTIANSHKRNNNIEKLKVDNEITHDKDVIKEEILNYYQNLYTESETWRPSANFDDVSRLSSKDREMLEKVFEEEEVHVVVQSSAPDKAPGPDGFTMAFFQKT